MLQSLKKPKHCVEFVVTRRDSAEVFNNATKETLDFVSTFAKSFVITPRICRLRFDGTTGFKPTLQAVRRVSSPALARSIKTNLGLNRLTSRFLRSSRPTGASPTFPGVSFSATGIVGPATIARTLVASCLAPFVRPIACGPFF